MELMKQVLRKPLPVAKQVAVIYAGVNGHLDDLPVKKVGKYEAELHEAMDSLYVDCVRLLNEQQALTPEVKKALDDMLRDFGRRFKA
jgi:F-type H+-transporting ATPase subunit alpha